MAIRKPLVIVTGTIKELPAGDTIDASASTWPIFKSSIAVGETLTIPTGYQSLFAYRFTNEGVLSNSGVFAIH